MVNQKVIAEELIKLHIYYHMAKRSIEEVEILAEMWLEDFENISADVFVEAVMTGDRSEVYSDYADAVRTLAVTEATNLSIENGGEVVEINDILG